MWNRFHQPPTHKQRDIPSVSRRVHRFRCTLRRWCSARCHSLRLECLNLGLELRICIGRVSNMELQKRRHGIRTRRDVFHLEGNSVERIMRVTQKMGPDGGAIDGHS